MIKPTTCLLLALAVAPLPAARAADAPTLEPFTASYAVRYGSIGVGNSRFTLRRDGAPGRWIFESRADASGLGRLFASGALVQTSWLVVDGSGVRPQRFTFDDGMERRAEDVDLQFDWSRGRVTGSAKGEAVDLPTQPGLQDPVSSQVSIMAALLAGREPAGEPMVDGGEIKPVVLRRDRQERITTPAGSFDTVVYASSRPGGQRVTWMWLAPQLQFAPVRVEQHRRGKRYFSIELESHAAGD